MHFKRVTKQHDFTLYGGLILMSALSTLWNWIVDENGKRQKTRVYK